MLYHIYELQHAAFAPARLMADYAQRLLKDPHNPLAHAPGSKSLLASLDIFEQTTRRYGKPAFDLPTTIVDGKQVSVEEEILLKKSFCQLKHFKRDIKRKDPKVLIVAPLSGHYATLLRDTVRNMLPDHDVYITDWRDARNVPLFEGSFDFDDYVDYVVEFLEFLGPKTHVIAVCQPSVPVFAATAIMSAEKNKSVPATLTLMGGPIDTRENPTEVNKFATSRNLEWFEKNVVVPVPFTYPGMMRKVYPGFLQLAGFLAMNLDRHMDAHWEMFEHLVQGDDESADNRKAFYGEYRSVMDMTSEFYLQTIRQVFQEHELPRGVMVSRGRPVDPSKITKTALFTVEGELDDISGIGQTKAAHKLCTSLPPEMKMHYEQKGCGHYGIFNGSKWRDQIAPRVKKFIAAHN
jgi:poly(3-hydroxybutyrate) depolymerase